MSNYSYFNKTAAVWDAKAKRIASGQEVIPHE
jgi:hypothetical protein